MIAQDTVSGGDNINLVEKHQWNMIHHDEESGQKHLLEDEVEGFLNRNVVLWMFSTAGDIWSEM